MSFLEIMHKNPLRPAASLCVLTLWTSLCIAAETTDVETSPGPEEPGVISRPLPEGVPSLQMSTDYARPALGFGTYAPVSQVEARAFRVEPFTIRAGLQTGIGYDDNVALTRTNKISSMFFTVAPSVSAGLEGATQRYYAVYRGNYGTYSSNAQDDYADHNFALSATNSWTGRFRTLANYDVTRGHTPRGITAASTTASEKWTQQSVRGSATYGAAGAQGGLQGDIGYSSRRYTDSAAAAAAEYDRFEIGGTFYYRVAPKTRALIGAAWADVDHPRDPSLDNREMRYSVGVTWDVLAKTTGRFRLGYTTKEFASPARSDFTGYSYEAAVGWVPQPQTGFDFSASRFLSEAFEGGSTFAVNTVGSVVWNQLWQRGIRSTANYAIGQVEQQGLNRTDTYQAWGARVSYGLSRSLRVGADFRHDARTSDAAGVEYTRNIILLTLETAL